MAAAPEPKSNLIVPESIRQILADHGRIMRVRKGHVLLAVGLQASGLIPTFGALDGQRR